MTLLIGIVAEKEVVLMADSYTNSSGLRNTVAPKVDSIGLFSIAHAGRTKDWYLYRSLVKEGDLLTDPVFHISTMKKLREIAAEREGEHAEVNLSLLLAIGMTLYYASDEGVIYQCDEMASAGLSWSMVELIYRETVVGERRSSDAVVDWGFSTMQRIQQVDRTIEVPPMCWMGTAERRLARKDS